MNSKRVQRPATPYEADYFQVDLIGLHPSELVQRYLDQNRMAMWAQARIWQDWRATIDNWVDGLDYDREARRLRERAGRLAEAA